MVIKANTYGYGFSLKEAEVGDQLMVSNGYGYYSERDYKPVRITKISKTRISTDDGNNWMIESHRRIGAGKWDKMSLRMYDEKIIKEAAAARKRQQLANEIGKQRFHELPLAKLERINAILRESDEQAAP
jgi:hypothetical protein